ncbi:MAG TPA: hypothetical protein PLF37_09140 [Planctomycetota bacterium]|nr:hypothetical protein [Planctomycetota bacterium]
MYGMSGQSHWYRLVAVLMLLASFSTVLAAQDGGSGEVEDGTKTREVLNPEEEITVDFVKKDIHVVMHYIGLRSGLNITVEGDIAKELTVIYRNVKPKDAIRSICESNELTYVENGMFVYVKKRVNTAATQANVTKAKNTDPNDPVERFNVIFEAQDLVGALMEVARVTKTPVFIPAVNRDQWDEYKGSPEDLNKMIDMIQSRKISMYMQSAEPRDILERLAQLGDLLIDKDTSKGYVFKYREMKSKKAEGAGPAAAEPDEELISRNWLLLGAKLGEVSQQVRNLLTTAGRIAYDNENSVILVTDVKSRMEREIIPFLDELKSRYDQRLRDQPIDDPMQVKSYTTLRDVTDNEFKLGLNSILSADGKVVTNADRNTVVVYDRRSKFKDIDLFFSAIDTEPEQVLLTAKLVEVTLDNYIGYGLQIFTEHGAQNLDNGRITGSSRGTSAQTVGNMFGAPTGFGPFLGTFASDRVSVTLEALANDGKVKTLIQPTAMVSNKKQAKITVGQEVPYLQTSAATGGVAQVSISFKEIAMILDVTPTILADGLMRLQIKFTIKEQIGNISIQQNDTPVLSNRESDSNVFIRDGETLVIGGLIRERERDQENGIPFLKDIPLLGYLFKTRNIRSEKTDLLFFLRPTIVSQKNGQPVKLGYALEREVRPMVWDDDDAKQLALVPAETTKPGAVAKGSHFDTGKRPKSAKDVNPNE